jgi:hypothetical protein
MLLVPEAFRNHPDLMKEYPEVCVRCVCVCVWAGGGTGTRRQFAAAARCCALLMCSAVLTAEGAHASRSSLCS